jgi:pyruvate formate lyase activating enzyme
MVLRLGGYEKLTLQDYPGYVAAICFTSGCQLRCPYCHNAGIVLSRPQTLEPDIDKKILETEFLSYVQHRRRLLSAIVISGGEPLLQNDIINFLHVLKELDLKVKLDTNGLLPQRLQAILEQNLVDYVALDFKNCKKYWAQTVGLSQSTKQRTADGLYENWQSSLALLRKGQVPYEIRTTVVRELHPIAILREMAESIAVDAFGQNEQWFLQSFAKNGPIINDFLEKEEKIRLSAYANEEMKEIQHQLKSLVPGIQLRI